MFPKVCYLLGLLQVKDSAQLFMAILAANITVKDLWGTLCDGGVYQKLSQGYFSVQTNISVTFNTDGIPVFRSSGFSFWPLYLCVNELCQKYLISCILGYKQKQL